MKNYMLLSLTGLMICFSSCDEITTTGCTDEIATNYNPDAGEDNGDCSYNADLISGLWYGDSLTYEVYITDELISTVMVLTANMTSEEFEAEYGVPKPNNEEEWLLLADLIPNEPISLEGESYTFNDSTINYYNGTEDYIIDYYFETPTRIVVIDTENSLGYAYLDIDSIGENELLLSNDEFTYMGIIPGSINIYLSK